jgi:hypothetical protein
MIAPTQDCVAEEAVWCDPQARAALEVLRLLFGRVR